MHSTRMDHGTCSKREKDERKRDQPTGRVGDQVPHAAIACSGCTLFKLYH